MNTPRLILSVVAVAVALFLFDFLFHGMMLGQSYADTADSWRSEEDMAARFPFQILCYFVISVGFCMVWALGFPREGVRCGAIYGFLLGVMGAGSILMMFVFTPIPDQFKLPWAIGGVLSAVVAGIVVALVYKPKASEPPADNEIR